MPFHFRKIATAKTEAIHAADESVLEKLRSYATTSDVAAARDAIGDAISTEA